MGAVQKLILRVVLAVVIGFVIGKLFFPDIQYGKIAGLAILIFGLSYLFEFLRNIGNGSNEGR